MRASPPGDHVVVGIVVQLAAILQAHRRPGNVGLRIKFRAQRRTRSGSSIDAMTP